MNAGIYAARVAPLRAGLSTLTTDNAQGEYYLTDVVAFAVKGAGAVAVKGSADALVGVNDRAQLWDAEEAVFRRIAERHRRAGVTVRGDARIDDAVTIGEDARIDAGVHLRGRSVVATGAIVDTGTVVVDSTIGEGAVIKAHSVITESSVGARAQIGPFAHLRPGSHIEDDAHIGNFVETKKTRVRRGAKANHLAYLGDGEIGPNANIGAGTIFCNYDGFGKHTTVIGEGVFIGSDSQLVAPVTIGKGAYVATGTTVTKDVPDDALAIGRTKHENKLGYASRLKSRLAAQKENKGDFFSGRWSPVSRSVTRYLSTLPPPASPVGSWVAVSGVARGRSDPNLSVPWTLSAAPAIALHAARQIRLRQFVGDVTRDLVLHLPALHVEVARRIAIGLHEDGHPLIDGDSEVSESVELAGVVGHELDGFDAQGANHGGRDVVLPRVHGQVQEPVRFDRVGAELLQRVRADLVDEADASAFLAEVEDHAGAAARDLCLRQLELLPAIALQRPEHLARQALGMNAERDGSSAAHVAHDEREMLVREPWMRLRIVPAKDV